MEHIPRADAKKFQKDNTTSWEYSTASEKMNVAHIKLDGRYPKEGFVANREADSIIHILDGTGVLGVRDGKRVMLAPHDQVHLSVGDAYFLEGSLEIIFSATPKWTPEQTTHINR